MKTKNIHIDNKTINIKTSIHGEDYISLTDMAKCVDTIEPRIVIQNWIRVRYTLDFIGNWEILYNQDFNRIEFDAVKNQSGSNKFTLSAEKWIKLTNAIGIQSSSGRYGGTFAHKDIAFEFATWISPEFKLYLIKEFQRLKSDETDRKSLDWNAKRMLTKINYHIHTNSIQKNIIVPNKISPQNSHVVYATEADVLNMALFGVTAKTWKMNNADKEGNMRDYADVYQLVCLSNLESINALLIKYGLSQQERLIELNETAITQMQSLIKNQTKVQKLIR